MHNPVLLPTLISWSIFAIFSVVLVIIDIREHRLPNKYVLPLYLVAISATVISVALGAPPQQFVRALVGSGCIFAVFAVMRVITAGGLGGGDVKLAGVLGWYLAEQSWSSLMVGLALGFFLGGVHALGAMVVRSNGRARMIPFGPALITGTWAALLLGADSYLL